ncbi:hypothetical protein SIP08_004949 [Klebsiella aerogenes]|uniref:hypothetical protein n=1 Tax=Klebsiella aerogenes TaxID=548 RepID=UPI001CFAF8CD|nr:hypothetical protein [Klebsiella aerogenes]EKV8810927.1 hypothetical protein [Klebsiella aerogenes]ELJ2007717.1 hypothetical protein [Klebsiella aerogenes]ELW9553339.1 hypothetical protein [Klebsiella aerogenes]MCB4376463.1 hypothetical protein [Klebsiella aerogenes]
MIRKSLLSLSLTVLLFFVAVISGRLLMMGVVAHRDTYFSCDAKIVVANGINTLALATTYFFEGNKGLVIFKGRLQLGDNSYNVSRKVLFNTNSLQNMSTLTSTQVDTSPADNTPTELLQLMLPAFFYQKNNNMEYTIYHQGWNDFIFSTGYVPLFYCRRN